MPRKTHPPRLPHAAPLLASMRPRPDAAENFLKTRRWRRRAGRFNEAAARCRGKPDPMAGGAPASNGLQ